jgi:hypothetical protein
MVVDMWVVMTSFTDSRLMRGLPHDPALAERWRAVGEC